MKRAEEGFRLTWLAFRHRVPTVLLLTTGVLFGGILSLAKPTYALMPLVGLVFYVLYMLKPPWAIVLSLSASPLLDQASLGPLHGFGFDLAGVVRGSALFFMWGAILTQYNHTLPGRKRLLFVSVLVLASFFLSLFFSIHATASIKAFFAFSYWITFYLYLTLTLDEYPMGWFVQWGLIAAGYVILATMAPYEIGHVYEPYTNGTLSIYGRYNSGPFNLAVSVAFLLPMLVILRTRWQRLAYLPLVPALLYILANTYVRTGAVIVALFVFYFLIQSRWTRWSIIGAVRSCAWAKFQEFESRLVGPFAAGPHVKYFCFRPTCHLQHIPEGLRWLWLDPENHRSRYWQCPRRAVPFPWLAGGPPK